MRLYYSGIGAEDTNPAYYAAGARDGLISIVDLHIANGNTRIMNPKRIKDIEEFRTKWSGHVFMDSGAFTFENVRINRSLKGNIKYLMNLEEYIAFVRKYNRLFDVIASLDVIGDPEKSLSNYKVMCREGLDYVLPAWHGGESTDYLDKYIRMCDYIGIGGIAHVASKRVLKLRYIKTAINYIKERDPHMKIHLYGVVDPMLLRMFGHLIESSDTTTWKMGRRWGEFFGQSLYASITDQYKGRIRHDFTASDAYNIYHISRLVSEINKYAEKYNGHDKKKEYLKLTKKYRVRTEVPRRIQVS